MFKIEFYSNKFRMNCRCNSLSKKKTQVFHACVFSFREEDLDKRVDDYPCWSVLPLSLWVVAHFLEIRKLICIFGIYQHHS